MAQIRLNNLCKRYDNGFVAVDHINLVIQDGEFLVLVGPSGCGKSTTLRMIAGLEEVSSGDIFLDDQRINRLEPGDRDIAMVFQNYALYPHMTVRDNLSFGLRMRRIPKSEIWKRVEEVSEILSLKSMLDRRPKQLSGGQRQRVALGRAIIRQPRAFLFDEPLSNLDAKLRVQMRTELARLHQRFKTTTVYVTHDQVEAMTLGDRIVVMKDGIIQQVDTPMAVYQVPANKFVASFIGSPSMNFLAGRIEGDELIAGKIRYPLKRENGICDFSRINDLKNVIFGFRPESLTVDPKGPLLATAKLDVVEQMGHETVVYFDLPEAQQTGVDSNNTLGIVARLTGRVPVQPGDQIDLHLPSCEWHLFAGQENQTGQQIRFEV